MTAARVIVALAVVAVFYSPGVVSEQGLDLILPEYEMVQEPIQQEMTEEAARIKKLVASVEQSAPVPEPKKAMKAPVPVAMKAPVAKAPVTVAPVSVTPKAAVASFLEDIKPTCDKNGECVCEIDPERCFSAPTMPVTTNCQKAMGKLSALKAKFGTAAGSAATIALNKGVITAATNKAEAACVYTQSHIDFKQSYNQLCADEIEVKNEKMQKKATKEKDFKEKSTKNEATAKKAVEGGQKCKTKEFATKKNAEAEVKTLKKQVQDAQESETKMSLKTKESGTKMVKKEDEKEKKIFTKEQKTKENAFKKSKEGKGKCEAKVKGINEKMYKRQKVSVTEQKEIYEKWKRHYSIEKTTKNLEAKHKKTAELAKKSELKEKKAEKAGKEKTDKKFAVEKKAKAVPIPQPKAAKGGPCSTTTGGTAKGEGCSFPFSWKGKTYYQCITDADHKFSFCLTAKKTLGYCKKGCKGAVHCKEEPKPPAPPAPKPAGSAKPPAVKPPVKPAGSAPPVPKAAPSAEGLCKLREKIQEKQLKSLKENLSKAAEKNDKAKNASTEKKSKCAQKVEAAQKKVEGANKAIKKGGAEKKAKAEKDTKLEVSQKKSYVKEASTKADEVALEKANKAKIVSLKKEAATKVATFKSNEGKSKKASAEKANKDPFADLKTYCTKLKKMQKLLITVKEVDGKKYSTLKKERDAKAKELKSKNVAAVKKLKTSCCDQTKETCSKIKTTSEAREKNAVKLAIERKAKMEAKCALTRQFDADQQDKLRFTICEAANGEITTLLKSVEHASSSSFKDVMAVAKKTAGKSSA
jgi:hypothetical protein